MLFSSLAALSDLVDCEKEIAEDMIIVETINMKVE
jgi:hypothetical protein